MLSKSGAFEANLLGKVNLQEIGFAIGIQPTNTYIKFEGWRTQVSKHTQSTYKGGNFGHLWVHQIETTIESCDTTIHPCHYSARNSLVTLHFLDDLGSATPNRNEDPQLVEEDMVNDNNASSCHCKLHRTLLQSNFMMILLNNTKFTSIKLGLNSFFVEGIPHGLSQKKKPLWTLHAFIHMAHSACLFFEKFKNRQVQISIDVVLICSKRRTINAPKVFGRLYEVTKT